MLLSLSAKPTDINLRVSMQFSGLNEVQSQLTVYIKAKLRVRLRFRVRVRLGLGLELGLGG